MPPRFTLGHARACSDAGAPDPLPTTSDGTFLYDTEGWQLSWDEDGTGPSRPELIASFDPNTNLAAYDFTIV